jgi:hypothetical protein
MAKAEKKVEKVSVTLVLSDVEAKALKQVLMDDINWDRIEHGKIAEEIYDALEDLELG